MGCIDSCELCSETLDRKLQQTTTVFPFFAQTPNTCRGHSVPSSAAGGAWVGAQAVHQLHDQAMRSSSWVLSPCCMTRMHGQLLLRCSFPMPCASWQLSLLCEHAAQAGASICYACMRAGTLSAITSFTMEDWAHMIEVFKLLSLPGQPAGAGAWQDVGLLGDCIISSFRAGASPLPVPAWCRAIKLHACMHA